MLLAQLAAGQHDSSVFLKRYVAAIENDLRIIHPTQTKHRSHAGHRLTRTKGVFHNNAVVSWVDADTKHADPSVRLDHDTAGHSEPPISRIGQRGIADISAADRLKLDASHAARLDGQHRTGLLDASSAAELGQRGVTLDILGQIRPRTIDTAIWEALVGRYLFIPVAGVARGEAGKDYIEYGRRRRKIPQQVSKISGA